MGLLLHHSVNVCVHMCPHGQPGVGCAPGGSQRPLCTGSHTLFLGRWAAGEGVRAGGRAGGWVGGRVAQWVGGQARGCTHVGCLVWGVHPVALNGPFALAATLYFLAAELAY